MSVVPVFTGTNERDFLCRFAVDLFSILLSDFCDSTSRLFYPSAEKMVFLSDCLFAVFKLIIFIGMGSVSSFVSFVQLLVSPRFVTSSGPSYIGLSVFIMSILEISRQSIVISFDMIEAFSSGLLTCFEPKSFSSPGKGISMETAGLSMLCCLAMRLRLAPLGSKREVSRTG